MKRKDIGVNLIFNLLKTITKIIFPLITFPYASRVLGVDGIGKVQYCNSTISYFTLIATLGISIYAVRQGAKYKDDREALSKFSKEILIINSISMALSYLLFTIFVLFFFKQPYYVLLILCSFATLFQTYSIEWLYQIKEDYGYISIRALIFNVISIILMFVFVHSPKDYIVYAIINMFGSFGSFFFNIFHAKKYINVFRSYNLNLKQHIKPILMIFGVSVASSIYMNLDTVMLGAMVGTVAVGLYTAAVKLIHLVKNLISSFSNVLFTRLSNYVGTGKNTEYKALLKNGVDFTMLFLIPCIVGMYMLSAELLYFLSGSEYTEATLAARILAINLYFSVLDGLIYYQVLLPFKHEKLASISTWIGAIVNLILNFFIIPIFSYTGAAFTTLIAELSVSFCLLYFAKNLIDIKMLFISSIRYLLFSIPIVICCIICKIMFANIFIFVAISVISSALLYFCTLLVFRDSITFRILSKVLRKQR